VISRDEVLSALMFRAGYRTWLVMTVLSLPAGIGLLLFTTGTWFAIGAVLFGQSLLGLVIFDAMRWISGIHDGVEQLEKRLVVSRSDVHRSIIIRGLVGSAAGVVFTWQILENTDVLMFLSNAIGWGAATAFMTYARLRPYLTSARRMS